MPARNAADALNGGGQENEGVNSFISIKPLIDPIKARQSPMQTLRIPVRSILPDHAIRLACPCCGGTPAVPPLLETLAALERPRELTSQVVNHLVGTRHHPDNIGSFLTADLPRWVTRLI
jgi:hypothetical protein